MCVIDLNRNVLRIGTTGTETNFLTESQLPEWARLSGAGDEESLGKNLKDLEDTDLQKAIADSAKTAQPSTPSDVRMSSPGTSRPSIPRDPSTEILPADPFNENDVKELVALGFTRAQVIAELRRFNGDKHHATAALFAKSLKF